MALCRMADGAPTLIGYCKPRRLSRNAFLGSASYRDSVAGKKSELNSRRLVGLLVCRDQLTTRTLL